jgi:hypothetical protein
MYVYAGFDALTAMAAKLAVFCDVTPCASVKCTDVLGGRTSNQSSACRLLLAVCLLGLLFDPEDVASSFLQNVGALLPRYTTLQFVITFHINIQLEITTWQHFELIFTFQFNYSNCSSFKRAKLITQYPNIWLCLQDVSRLMLG